MMLGVIYLILCMLIGKELAGLLLSKKIGYNQIWLTLWQQLLAQAYL